MFFNFTSQFSQGPFSLPRKYQIAMFALTAKNCTLGSNIKVCLLRCPVSQLTFFPIHNISSSGQLRWFLAAAGLKHMMWVIYLIASLLKMKPRVSAVYFTTQFSLFPHANTYQYEKDTLLNSYLKFVTE